MCYIMGAFSSRGAIAFEDLFAYAEGNLLLRGRDTVGAYYKVSKTDGTKVRSLSKGPNRRDQLRGFLSKLPTAGQCIMLQTRAIPDGVSRATSLGDMQPFDRCGWVVSHNGTIANDRELRMELDEVVWGREPSVDSIVLPYLFSKTNVYNTTREQLEGSFAIAAYAKKRNVFYLAKNFQPLYYGVSGDVLYYSSLSTVLTPTAFPPYKLFSYNSGDAHPWADLYRGAPDKSVLVACSSGLDSTVTLRLYQVLGYKVGALFFNYGQQAESVERYCSRKICEILDIPWYEATLPLGQFNSPLLQKGKPELDPLKDAESTFSYVPQRNLIMTAFALAMAEQLGYGGVALGMNLSDGGSYPDNGVPFLEKLGEVTPYSSNVQTRLQVGSPFVNLTKSEILEVGLEIGVPFDYICSCYYPELSDDGYPVYCNSCGSDVHYSNAWGKLGFVPPNIGFEGTNKSLTKPSLSTLDPKFHALLFHLPYWEAIEGTL